MTNQGVGGFPSATGAQAQQDARYDMALPFPQNVSGRWYGPTVINTAAANATGGTLNRVEYSPILLSAGTLDRIGANHFGSATASELARLGLYASSATDLSRPGSLVIDAGTIDLSSATAVKTINISVAVTRGVYWLAVCRQGPTNTATLVYLPTIGAGMQSPVVAPSVDSTTLYNTNRTVYTETGVSGALPAVATPARNTLTYVYAAAVRYV